MMKVAHASTCCECSEYRACMAVDVSGKTPIHYCLLHFSISDKNSVTPMKNSAFRSRVTDQVELSTQEIKVKEMWKGAAAEVILQMFDYEKADQKAARLAQAPAIIPRKKSVFHKRTTVTSAIISKSSDTKNTADLSDPDDTAAGAGAASGPSYSWRRGALADDDLGAK